MFWIILMFFVYYIYMFAFYIIAKINTVIDIKKVEIKHISIAYYITSLISLFLIYKVCGFFNFTELMMDLIRFIFLLYAFISVTYLIPYKTYFITQNGIYMTNLQVRISNLFYFPYKSWKRVTIQNIKAEHDVFFIDVNDKHFGFLNIQLSYVHFYQIFKNK